MQNQSFSDSDDSETDTITAPSVYKPCCWDWKSLKDFGITPLPGGSLCLPLKRVIKRKWSEIDGAKNSKIDFFEFIPDEILLHIFSFLPSTSMKNCALTCKRFYNICMDGSFPQIVKQPVVNGYRVASLVTRGIRILRLAHCEIKGEVNFLDLPTKKFRTVNPHFISNLQFLDLSYSITSPSNIKSILSRCIHLQKLSLEQCKIDYEICSLISQNHQLRVLNISSCLGLTRRGLKSLFMNNKLASLTELNVGWTQIINPADITLFCQLLPHSLVILNATGFTSMADYHVESLCQSCPNLKELDLNDNYQLTPRSLEIMVYMLPNLKKLHLCRSIGATPGTISILQTAKTLKDLTITIDPKKTKELAEHLPHIKINTSLFSNIARPKITPRKMAIKHSGT